MLALSDVGPEAVHVAPDSPEVEQSLRATARHMGMTLFEVDLASVARVAELHRLFEEVLRVPYPVVTWDGLLSYMAQVDDWLPNPNGYVLLLKNASQLRRRNRRAFANLVGILPDVSDRWQTGGQRFHVVFTGDVRLRAAVREIVERENLLLAEAFDVAWRREIGMTHHPVVVRDHAEA